MELAVDLPLIGFPIPLPQTDTSLLVTVSPNKLFLYLLQRPSAQSPSHSSYRLISAAVPVCQGHPLLKAVPFQHHDRLHLVGAAKWRSDSRTRLCPEDAVDRAGHLLEAHGTAPALPGDAAPLPRGRQGRPRQSASAVVAGRGRGQLRRRRHPGRRTLRRRDKRLADRPRDGAGAIATDCGGE